jgi:membrane protein required for beta-lactamase induction
MARRITALLLWSYFAWYLASMLASVTEGPAVAGPIAAVLTAVLGVTGWLRSRRAAQPSTPQVELHPSR